MLLTSVEPDLARKQEDALAARSTEAWLMTLRKNLKDIEHDDAESIERRRELLKLLVDKIVVGRTAAGRTKVDITYRFGPLEPQATTPDSVGHVNNSPEL